MRGHQQVRTPTSPQRSVRRLRAATVLTPVALLLGVAGPGLAALEAAPVPPVVGRSLVAALGAVAGILALAEADGSIEDLPTIDDQNLRVLVISLAILAIVICSGWLWAGTVDLLRWLVEGSV